jgi:hypothetical protein
MSWLGELRDLAPQRALTMAEAYGVAERQALRLLRLAQVSEPPVSTEALAYLPWLSVSLDRRLGTAGGAAKWKANRWIVLLNANEGRARRRFSLGHELKHIIDHRDLRLHHGRLESRAEKLAVEQLCHHFAACLLMPRPWVKRAWGLGVQSELDLAELFEVSPQAMLIRLRTLGLAEPTTRCGIDNDYLRSEPLSLPNMAA